MKKISNTKMFIVMIMCLMWCISLIMVCLGGIFAVFGTIGFAISCLTLRAIDNK